LRKFISAQVLLYIYDIKGRRGQPWFRRRFGKKGHFGDNFGAFWRKNAKKWEEVVESGIYFDMFA
jgi:hypothetical protein